MVITETYGFPLYEDADVPNLNTLGPYGEAITAIDEELGKQSIRIDGKQDQLTFATDPQIREMFI